MSEHQPGPLAGLLVVDMASMMAAPSAAMMLADFGATVLKVERPDGGDVSRQAPMRAGGTSVWWRLLGRNKEAITLNLKDKRAQEILRRILRDADVLIENNRPGKLEAMGLAPAVLHVDNPGLVILRVTGWGQTGPYADRATFGTQIEAMSGFAYANGHPDQPPTLPSFALADGCSGYLGAFSVMTALWAREHDPEHRGQVIDFSIFEALFGMLGPQSSAYDKLGLVQERQGSRAPLSAPRNVYRAKDGRYVAVSTSGGAHIAHRMFEAMGRKELVTHPHFATLEARLEHIDEIDATMQEWVGQRDADDIVRVLSAAGASVAPVYSIADVFRDPHLQARELIVDAPSADIGPIKMQNVFPKLSRTPGAVRWSGRPLGADTEHWLLERLGLSQEDVAALRRDGAI
jgi:crotonobetainyl-CoA:carnitine CoA-transferase CaiB-like acyl-CoA transferase